mgnify:CR=1 FL=1|tara:strand:+ start:119 stop:379 length:261 start_codon:yes stop_codon:yes gene_type:complete
MLSDFVCLSAIVFLVARAPNELTLLAPVAVVLCPRLYTRLRAGAAAFAAVLAVVMIATYHSSTSEAVLLALSTAMATPPSQTARPS